MNKDFILKVGVKVLLVSPSGKILFLKRSKKVYGNKEFLLDIPGGRIDANQDLITNLKREVFEETGKTEFEEPFLLGAQDLWYDNEHTVRLTYISRVTDEVVVLSEEHTAFEWLSLEDIEKRAGEISDLRMSFIKDKMSFIKDIVENNGKTQ